MPNNFDCEAWLSRRWELISIDVAKSLGKIPFRCPECRGQVVPHSGGKNADHAEHKHRHTGCSRGDCFDGKSRPHPIPLVIEMENTTSDVRSTEEVFGELRYYEGAVAEIIVNKYERNRKARQACINHHGSLCAICSFDFEVEFGPIGKEFIHVHHLVDLASIGKEYQIDPIEDLIPVCPNCHAILHRRIPSYTLDEVRKFRQSKSS